MSQDRDYRLCRFLRRSGLADGLSLDRRARHGGRGAPARMGDRYAKFATEHLSVAAARIESCLVGTGGNDGGNVIQFPALFLREETKKGLAISARPL